MAAGQNAEAYGGALRLRSDGFDRGWHEERDNQTLLEAWLTPWTTRQRHTLWVAKGW
jgi:hypothetical protein